MSNIGVLLVFDNYLNEIKNILRQIQSNGNLEFITKRMIELRCKSAQFQDAAFCEIRDSTTHDSNGAERATKIIEKSINDVLNEFYFANLRIVDMNNLLVYTQTKSYDEYENGEFAAEIEKYNNYLSELGETERDFLEVYNEFFGEFLEYRSDIFKVCLLPNHEQINEPIPKKSETINITEKLTHKQQILLLDDLGMFDLPNIRNLNDIEKGKLFGFLLNRNQDNTENYIRYRHTTTKGKVDNSYFLHDHKNTQKIKDVLKEVGLKKK